jgi:hypothetical protein
MPWVGFEPMILAVEEAKHALDLSAIVTGRSEKTVFWNSAATSVCDVSLNF